MKRILIYLLFVLLVFKIAATVGDYSFYSTQGSYSEISGGTVHGTAANDNECFLAIPIGFSFTYNGVAYTSISISSNGFVAMGDIVVSSNTAISSSVGTNNIVSALNRDIKSQGNGSLKSASSGIAPNRVFTVQWTHYRRVATGAASDDLSFQIQLLENGNKVQFVYGPCMAVTVTTASVFQVGLRGDSNADFKNRSTTTNWNATIAGTANNSNCTLSATVFPANGLVFIFSLASIGDLQSVSCIGNIIPVVNQPSNYTVNIYNGGTATQSAYTVKLMSGTTELASAAGPTIAAGATAPVALSWTPTTEGFMTIFGRVVLADDINPANDDSPSSNISVQPSGVILVSVGEGNLSERVPWDFFYKNSLHEALYYPAELGVMGTITSMAFYNNFVTDLPNMRVKIWLGTTQLADLSAGWILPSDGLTLVYDGTVNFPTGQNIIIIPLQTPFQYTGGNLVFYANRPMDPAYYSSSDNFLAQTIGTNRARKLYSDSMDFDPTAPPNAGTLSGTFSRTTFCFAYITAPPPAISQQLNPIQFEMNTPDTSIDLDAYFESDYPLSYTIYGTMVSGSVLDGNILSLIPASDWYGVEYLTVRATNFYGFVEQTLKVTVVQTGEMSEDFNLGGTMPASWTSSHVGSTAFPWQAVLIDGSNYVMKTMSTLGSTANERLFSPSYNLSAYKDIVVSFDSDFLPYGSGSGSFAYTLNNVSYTVVESYTAAATGLRTYALANLEARPTVKFRWIYANTAANSGENNYWTIDNFNIFGVVIDTQAPIVVSGLAITGQSSSSVSLSWQPSSDIYFGSYELNVSTDSTVDTSDQLWGPVQDPALHNAGTTGTTITGLVDGDYWIAIRAVDQSSNVSPLSEPILVHVDGAVPIFSDPVPVNQPIPDWSASRTVTIGCTISDNYMIDAGSIQYRFDANGNGSYGPEEAWTAIPRSFDARSARNTTSVAFNVTAVVDGLIKYEFKATDEYQNTGYSGTSQLMGIEDDWVVRIDSTPPEPLTVFYAQEVQDNSIQLRWMASSDLNFLGYRIHYSTSAEVSSADPAWDWNNDPNLGIAGTGLLSTTITGLNPATRYYFLLLAMDVLGGTTQYPLVITAMTTSSAAPMAPANLTLSISGNLLILDWDDVTQDILGNPIVPSYYAVFVGDTSDFACNFDTLIGTVETSYMELADVVEYADRLFFRVVAVSGAIRMKNEELRMERP